VLGFWHIRCNQWKKLRSFSTNNMNLLAVMWNTTTKKQTFNTDREGQWCDKIWGQCWLDYDHDFVDRCYSVSDMLSYIARPLSNVSGCTNIGPTLCFKKWHPFILTITKVKCWPIVMIFVGMYRTLFATNRYIPFTNINTGRYRHCLTLLLTWVTHCVINNKRWV